MKNITITKKSQQDVISCEECGGPYSSTTGFSMSKKKFCSHRCFKRGRQKIVDEITAKKRLEKQGRNGKFHRIDAGGCY